MRIIGEVGSMKAADASTLRAYHTQWYSPKRMVVILAGKLPEDTTVLATTERFFSHLSNLGDLGNLGKVKEHQTKPALSVVTKPDASQAHLMLGLRTFARGNEERFAWSILNLIMGVGFTSRLFKEIREKRGLCYTVRSSSDSWADVGYWSIYAGVATEKVEEATRAILGELVNAAGKGVTEEEIVVAKKRIKTILAFKSEDPEFFTEYYGRQELFGEPMLTIEDYIKKIESVTKPHIDQLMNKYFVTNTLNMALVWNRKREEKLTKLLRLE